MHAMTANPDNATFCFEAGSEEEKKKRFASRVMEDQKKKKKAGRGKEWQNDDTAEPGSAEQMGSAARAEAMGEKLVKMQMI